MFDLYIYQHSYTNEWYLVSSDGRVCRAFATEEEAKYAKNHFSV